jgi:hypothetical protein
MLMSEITATAYGSGTSGSNPMLFIAALVAVIVVAAIIFFRRK